MTALEIATTTHRPATAGRRSLVRAAAFVAFLHLVGWGLLVGVVAPRHYQVGGGVLGVGLGLTAYVLGMRHAFDADHIAAIDNTTRKLIADGQRPVTVGFWFSLGHSSVVLVMVMGAAVGVRSLAEGAVPGSRLQHVASVWGPLVSGVFLLLIAALNMGALRGIVGALRTLRSGTYDDADLERHLAARGVLSRLLAGVDRAVRAPWHMFPIGFLFGLGFDTVTEIGLLVIAGGAAASSLPWWAVLTLPVLFAAGMSLLDTIDGAFMTLAYGWASSEPLRKIYYNLAVTALSVVIALGVGAVTLGSMLGQQLGGPWTLFDHVDLRHVGYTVAGTFVLVWAGAVAIWRRRRGRDRCLTPTA